MSKLHEEFLIGHYRINVPCHLILREHPLGLDADFSCQRSHERKIAILCSEFEHWFVALVVRRKSVANLRVADEIKAPG